MARCTPCRAAVPVLLLLLALALPARAQEQCDEACSACADARACVSSRAGCAWTPALSARRAGMGLCSPSTPQQQQEEEEAAAQPLAELEAPGVGRRAAARAVSCPTGLTNCKGGSCTDTLIDKQNCGACGRACSGGTNCFNGVCSGGGTTTCATGLTSCSGVCKNLTSDASNCGACGAKCAGGKVCAGARCVCPAGETDCSGVCTNLLTNNNNCGACGNVCTGGKQCWGAGTCSCASYLADCGGTCKDLLADETACGSCATACSASQVCTSGVCNSTATITCPTGQTNCGGYCKALSSDVTACGSCTTVCGATQQCVSGVCKDPTVDPVASSIKLDFGPLRAYWSDGAGYCGEFSVQMAAMYWGVWISQDTANVLGNGELLLGVNLETLVGTTLGLNMTKYSNYAITASTLSAFMVWMKRELLEAKAPVVFAARARGLDFDEYDHIMPMYGVVTKGTTLTTYDAADSFTWTTGYKNAITRAVGAVGSQPFYATGPPGQASNNCQYDMPNGGCISSDEGNYACSVRGLRSNYRLFLPMRLEITRWADGTLPANEPRNSRTVAGSYKLDLSRAVAALPVGSTFTVFRFNMVKGSAFASGNALSTLSSLSAVNTLCSQVACRKASYSVASSASLVLPDTTTSAAFGTVASGGNPVFFVAVKGTI